MSLLNNLAFAGLAGTVAFICAVAAFVVVLHWSRSR